MFKLMQESGILDELPVSPDGGDEVEQLTRVASKFDDQVGQDRSLLSGFMEQ